ncbi:MAG: hypothetical protein JWS11_2971 [Cypionkella sp.]|nr:hypothetical protein [Cypionkella sp.]
MPMTLIGRNKKTKNMSVTSLVVVDLTIGAIAKSRLPSARLKRIHLKIARAIAALALFQIERTNPAVC